MAAKDLREDCVSIPRLDLAGNWTVFGGQCAYLLDADLMVGFGVGPNPDTKRPQQTLEARKLHIYQRGLNIRTEPTIGLASHQKCL